MVCSWKWSSSNLIASRSEAPLWRIGPSLIRSPTKHNISLMRLVAGPGGGGAATYYRHTSLLPPILSCHVKCCWLKSHFPCPVWSCVALHLQSAPAMHASCPWVCESIVSDCVYCNAFLNVWWDILTSASRFKCPSIVCLSVVPFSSPEEYKLFAALFCAPFWNAAWPSYAWQTSSVCWLLYKR